jgi:hypothetical protein
LPSPPTRISSPCPPARASGPWRPAPPEGLPSCLHEQSVDIEAIVLREGVHWINELSDRARHRKTPGLLAWQPHPLKKREAQVFLTPLGVLAVEQSQGGGVHD